MDMFGKPRIDMTLIQTTSKEAIKRSALYACGGDVKTAQNNDELQTNGRRSRQGR